MKSKPKDKKLTRNKARDTGRLSARRARQRSGESVQAQDVWSVTALKEESTGRLRNEGTFPVGDGTTGMRKFGAEISAKVIVQGLRKYSNAITKDSVARVSRLLRSASTAPVILTHVPGWKFDAHTGRRIAFVTPGGIVGPKARRFRWDHGSKPPTATEAGTREGWLALATLAEQSSYIGFAIMTALACPLVRFANLPE